MTSPAGGPRLPWSQLPEHVRVAVEDHLGSPVVEAVNQHGGFSPGTAARIRCADGRRAFVKAVGTPLNEHSPALHRAEARVAAALPSGLPTPRLQFGYDSGDWVALVFDEVDGCSPRLPWSVADASRVLDAVGELAAALTPCPLPDATAAADLLRSDLTSWERIAAAPPADLDTWEATHLDRLCAAGRRLVAPSGPLSGDTLVHLDLRADNILIGADGGVVIVDWPWGCRGPRWLDSVLFALDPMVAGGHDPERLLRGRAVLSDADPADITDLLLALAGMWARAGRQPAPAAMPTLRAHQRRCHDAALSWGRRRSTGG